MFENIHDKKIVIAGTIRNCSESLERNILIINKAFEFFKNIYWIIVESDSDDNTLEICSSLEEIISNFYCVIN